MKTRVYDFHGGVHPPENKHQSTRTPIAMGPVAAELIVPVQQHIGSAASPIVKVGERVLKGQMIAEPTGRFSTSVHAPTSGIIKAIEPHAVPHASGMHELCIRIETDGKDEWQNRETLTDYAHMPASEVLEYIRNHGISGMGGAGFPTDVKLHIGDNRIINTLVINAAECEPYITADDTLMREHAERVIGGIEIIAHLLKVTHVMIGIEDNKPQAIHALEAALKNCALNIDLVVVPTKYPSGGEKQLIKLLTNLEIPSGKIPADIGIVCHNVGTAAAIYDAVYQGRPLISRIVTVTGEAVAQPQNFETLIGTPFSALLEAAGLNENALSRLVVGGPMMGFTVDDLSTPVVKTTNCLIAGTAAELPPPQPANPCIRCGMCEQACPAELLPQQLFWFSQGREFDKAKHHNLFDCIECGACSYVCPSNIPLVQYYRFAKSEIRQEEAEQRKADHARERFEARQARKEAEKREKEERRKQRAAEAAKAQAARKDKAAGTTTTSVAPATDVKTLKTNAAVARTKLKKAQKAFEAAKEAGADNLAELEAAFKAAEQKAKDAQQALENAESGASAPANTGPDLKQLKTNAAVARTKLKKAEKALQTAEDKGQEGVEQLRDTVKELTAKAEAAQKAYDDAQSAPQGGAPEVDIKQLKTNAAVARTKLKQAEKALAKAQAEGADNIAELEAKVKEQQVKVTTTQQAYEAAESGNGNANGPSAEQLAELKSDMEKAQAKVEKAQKALDEAIANESPAAEKMKAGVEKLQAKFEEARKAYEDATGASSQPAVSAEQLAELKADVDAMQAKVDKAQKALDDAIANESPAADKMKAGVAKLQAKLDEAQNAYKAAAGSNAKPAVSDAQLAELKADAQAMQAKVDKARKALDDAIAKQSPAADKMKAGVEKLQAKLDEAIAEFTQAGGEWLTPVAEPAKPDMKALRQQVSIMRTKLKKAEKQLADSTGEGDRELEAEVERLSSKLQQAQAQLDTAEEQLQAAAAEEGIDLKQLKIDAAMARAQVTKTERAIAKADENSTDDQADLEQSLQAARARAAELEQTLSRFE